MCYVFVSGKKFAEKSFPVSFSSINPDFNTKLQIKTKLLNLDLTLNLLKGKLSYRISLHHICGNNDQLKYMYIHAVCPFLHVNTFETPIA